MTSHWFEQDVWDNCWQLWHFDNFVKFDNSDHFWQYWQWSTIWTIFDNFVNFDNFGQFGQFWPLLRRGSQWLVTMWYSRHWLQFWQLRTWIHDNLCSLTIKSDTGQHLQLLRCLWKQCLIYEGTKLHGSQMMTMMIEAAQYFLMRRTVIVMMSVICCFCVDIVYVVAVSLHWVATRKTNCFLICGGDDDEHF